MTIPVELRVRIDIATMAVLLDMVNVGPEYIAQSVADENATLRKAYTTERRWYYFHRSVGSALLVIAMAYTIHLAFLGWSKIHWWQILLVWILFGWSENSTKDLKRPTPPHYL